MLAAKAGLQKMILTRNLMVINRTTTRLALLSASQVSYFATDNSKQWNIYDGYRMLTDDEKRAKQKERRLKRKGI